MPDDWERAFAEAWRREQRQKRRDERLLIVAGVFLALGVACVVAFWWFNWA